MNAPIMEAPIIEHQVGDDVLQVSLMEEPINSDDSGTPALQLLAALREYHQLRNFSHRERFGTPDSNSSRALSELGQAQRFLRELASQASDRDSEFIIQAALTVRKVPKTH